MSNFEKISDSVQGLTCAFRTFEDACEAIGVQAQGAKLMPGRYSRLDLINDPSGRNDGSVWVAEDASGGCVFNWKTAQRAGWSKKSQKFFEEHLAYMEKQHKRERCANTANLLLSRATPVSSHPYLEKKRVTPHVGTLFCLSNADVNEVMAEEGYFTNYGTPYAPFAKYALKTPLLLVPLLRDGKLATVQLIAPDSSKRFLKGGHVSGAYWRTRSLQEFADSPVIGIAEGIATALSVDLVDDFPCVAAMSCMNLGYVAQIIRRVFPLKKIIILADAGRGEEHAEKAALLSGGIVAVPRFDEYEIAECARLTGNPNPTDWNDYYVSTGELTRSQDE